MIVRRSFLAAALVLIAMACTAQPGDDGGARTFRGDSVGVAIALPANWLLQMAGKGPVWAMHVAADTTIPTDDPRWIGFGFTRMHGFGLKPDHTPTDSAMIEQVLALDAGMGGIGSNATSVVNQRRMRFGEFRAVVTERQTQFKAGQAWCTEFEFAMHNGRDLVTGTFRAPKAKFEQYRPTFERALASLVVK